MSNGKSVADLRAELMAAEQAEAVIRQQRLLETPVRYQYFIAPADKLGHFGKMYDDTCVKYTLVRVILNMDEAKAVGHHEWDLSGGGMSYLYNKVSHRIVCAIGGGSAYISDNWNGPSDGADDEAFWRIGYFLEACPNGGDITGIVEDYLEARRP